ncbi:MAG: aspartate--tRNA ligase [Candidatus Magasanikbacteria bacterium]|nr:aspartate--tRNA ligase [Candidatus Magasanikbacteria bacterium]
MRDLVLETTKKVGQEVVLKGWVNARRNMGKIVFLDLRDRSGIVQVVGVPAELSAESQERLKEIRPEWVVEIRGVVNERGEKQKNPAMPTGLVEVLAKELIVLNTAETPPFEIDKDTSGISEELRLKYRYLDLRSDRMIKNLDRRHLVVKFIRDYLSARGFIEVETPLLTKGTPEGAREFIVPSRLHAGKFYVLPQSPQQFKQLLMVAGVEKYFQIARALRDEDQRGDRQPEHTQLDIEMSFVTQDDVLNLVEDLFTALVKEKFPNKILSLASFPRISYDECLKKYGTDKPDLRADKNNPHELAFAWIVDFPMFEKDENGNIQAMHHPFCAPQEPELLDSDPLKMHAAQYDLVLNGYELASGSIRIHNSELQSKIFKIMGLSAEEAQNKFGHMLEAFTYGAPPHGGIAPGIDRLVMLLAGEPNIREVIAFPKTGDARDLMMSAPSDLPEQALKDAHIKIVK